MVAHIHFCNDLFYEHSQLSSAIVSIGMANDAENSKNQSAFRKIVHSQISQNTTAEKDRELEFDPEECPLREEEHIRYTEKWMKIA